VDPDFTYGHVMEEGVGSGDVGEVGDESGVGSDGDGAELREFVGGDGLLDHLLHSGPADVAGAVGLERMEVVGDDGVIGLGILVLPAFPLGGEARVDGVGHLLKGSVLRGVHVYSFRLEFAGGHDSANHEKRHRQRGVYRGTWELRPAFRNRQEASATKERQRCRLGWVLRVSEIESAVERKE